MSDTAEACLEATIDKLISAINQLTEELKRHNEKAADDEW